MKNYFFSVMYAVNTATGEEYYSRFSKRYYDAERVQDRERIRQQQLTFMNDLRHGNYMKTHPYTAITSLLLYEYQPTTGEEPIQKKLAPDYVLDRLRVALRITECAKLRAIITEVGIRFKQERKISAEKLPILLTHLDNLTKMPINDHETFKYDNRIFNFYAKR